MKLAIVILMAMGIGTAAASEEWLKAQEVMAPACEQWVKTFCPEKAFETWSKRTLDRADSIVSEGRASNREEAIKSMVLDWMWDNESKLKKKDHKALKVACFYFLLLKNQDIEPPGVLKNNFNIDEAIKLAEELVAMSNGKNLANASKATPSKDQ